MFAAYVSLALLAASSVSGLAVPRTPKQPANWWSNLESYPGYNARYNALGCKNQHNTPFFDACCHPLLKTQSPSSLPAVCNKASVTATSTSAVPSATDDDDCDDGPESSSATLTATSAAPTATDDGDDDCEPCDDEDDDNCVDVPVSSTFAISSTPAPASTSVTSTPASSLSVSSRAPSSSPKPTRSVTVTPTSNPAPTSTAAPTSTKPTKTSSSPAPSPSTVSGGFATFFFQGGVAGACGDVSQDSDLIAAIDERRYGNPGVKSPLCGSRVRVINTKNNKSVVVTIKDDCPTCTNSNSIDLSQGAFNKIATEDEGIVPVKLEFL